MIWYKGDIYYIEDCHHHHQLKKIKICDMLKWFRFLIHSFVFDHKNVELTSKQMFCTQFNWNSFFSYTIIMINHNNTHYIFFHSFCFFLIYILGVWRTCRWSRNTVCRQCQPGTFSGASVGTLGCIKCSKCGPNQG